MEDKNQNNWYEWANDIYASSFTPLLKWRRLDMNGNRFYYANTPEGTKVACGITTAISKTSPTPYFLEKWKEDNPNWRAMLAEMAKYGTLLHTGMVELMTLPCVPEATIERASEFDKKQQFIKDLASIRQFILDYKFEPIFIEVILSKELINGMHVCTAIDLFGKMTIPTKVKKEVQDGFYVRGEKKGLPKFTTETTETFERCYGVVDLKSNFHNKEEKSFFDSHKEQLVFGRDCLMHNFGIPKNEIRMFNLSTVAWRTTPKYELKEWKDEPNEFGYTTSQVLEHKIKLGLMDGSILPKGTIIETGEVSMQNIEVTQYTYEEYADKMIKELEQ